MPFNPLSLTSWIWLKLLPKKQISVADLYFFTHELNCFSKKTSVIVSISSLDKSFISVPFLSIKTILFWTVSIIESHFYITLFFRKLGEVSIPSNQYHTCFCISCRLLTVLWVFDCNRQSSSNCLFVNSREKVTSFFNTKTTRHYPRKEDIKGFARDRFLIIKDA